jgi:hypothetical protein
MRIDPNTGAMTLGVMAQGPAFAPIMAALSLAATAAGTIVSTMGALQAGEAAQAAANYKATQLNIKGNEEFAAAQRNVAQERRKKDLAQSQLQARAAQSTGDTTDTTVMNLGAGIEEQGEFRALTEFYRGENAKLGYEGAAAGSVWEGQQAKTASRWKAAGTLLDGVSSLGDKYAKLYG